MVSPETKNSSMRMYHGPTSTRPAAQRRRSRSFVLGSDLEVVVDDGHLAVEEEALVGRVRLHEVQEPVDELDEAHAERLEGLVPLAVPVRVRDDGDATRGHRANVGVPRGRVIDRAADGARRGRGGVVQSSSWRQRWAPRPTASGVASARREPPPRALDPA